jgi:ABC-type Zn2+ transport system substrate-binding protein/surface adhesin
LEQPEHDESREPRNKDKDQHQKARVEDFQHALMLTVRTWLSPLAAAGPVAF